MSAMFKVLHQYFVMISPVLLNAVVDSLINLSPSALDHIRSATSGEPSSSSMFLLQQDFSTTITLGCVIHLQLCLLGTRPRLHFRKIDMSSYEKYPLIDCVAKKKVFAFIADMHNHTSYNKCNDVLIDLENI